MSIRLMKLAGMIFAVALLSFAAGTIAQGRYPEMNQAEGALRAALGHLHGARDVFGGHKANAEGLINQAIGELEAGKTFAPSTRQLIRLGRRLRDELCVLRDGAARLLTISR